MVDQRSESGVARSPKINKPTIKKKERTQAQQERYKPNIIYYSHQGLPFHELGSMNSYSQKPDLIFNKKRFACGELSYVVLQLCVERLGWAPMALLIKSKVWNSWQFERYKEEAKESFTLNQRKEKELLMLQNGYDTSQKSDFLKLPIAMDEGLVTKRSWLPLACTGYEIFSSSG